MVQVQFKYRQERDIYDDHATSTFAVQAGERDLYLMVMQRVQLKSRLERDISDCHGTGAFEVQARKR